MDWKKTFQHGQWVIHGIFAVSIIASLGSTLFALRLNHLLRTEEERTLRISTLLEKMKTESSFEKIGKYISWAEATKAQDKMRELTRDIAQLEEELEFKSSPDLGASLRIFNQHIGQTSGMSDPDDALRILKQKVNALADVAHANKFKNISLISERMKVRLGGLTGKNVGGSVQVSYLKSDVRRLQELLRNSTLAPGEKAGLSNRFTSLESELELLGSLNTEARSLKTQMTDATLALSRWTLEAEKKAVDLKGVKLQKQNQLVIILTGLVGFLITAWLGLAYLFRWQRAKLGSQVENEVKSVIEKGILGDQRFMVDHYSEETRDDIVRLLDDLKLKLNLGSMLHEGLPFAGCMIDNTFRLTWHNGIFLEQFYLSEEEVRSEAFNWDYIREYLNLNEDPIYQALVNKIAGIYPVKLKQDELAPMQPYEMYVTPITVNREDRVMVFFYPLISVNEAITGQVNLARESVQRFVSLWNEDRLDEDELRLMEKDFKANDLEESFDLLTGIFSRVSSEKEECLRTINDLEKETQALRDELSRWEETDLRRKELVRQECRLVNDLRETFLTSVDKGEVLLTINKTIMQQNDELRSEAVKLQENSLVQQRKSREMAEILGNLEAVKSDYKKLKLELLEVKTRLISLNASLLGQLPAFDEAQTRLATRYKDELARLDVNVVSLDKKLSQLDVLLAKLQMMNERLPQEQVALNFQTSQKDHALREAISEIQKSLGMTENKIVESFQTLHSILKKESSREPNVDAYLS